MSSTASGSTQPGQMPTQYGQPVQPYSSAFDTAYGTKSAENLGGMMGQPGRMTAQAGGGDMIQPPTQVPPGGYQPQPPAPTPPVGQQTFPDGRVYQPPQFGLTPNYQPYVGLNNQIEAAYQNQFYHQPPNPTENVARWNQIPYANQRGLGPSPWPSLFGNPNTWGGPVGGGGMGGPVPKDGSPVPPQQPPQTPPGGYQPPPGVPPGTPPPHGDVFPPQGPQFPSAPPPAPTPGAQAPGGGFNDQYNAIRNKFGASAADSYATKNWNSGGSQALQASSGGDQSQFLARTNAATPGGNAQNMSGGRTVTGPDGQRYYVADSGVRSQLPKGSKSLYSKGANSLFNQPGWLAQNAVKL